MLGRRQCAAAVQVLGEEVSWKDIGEEEKVADEQIWRLGSMESTEGSRHYPPQATFYAVDDNLSYSWHCNDMLNHTHSIPAIDERLAYGSVPRCHELVPARAFQSLFPHLQFTQSSKHLILYVIGPKMPSPYRFVAFDMDGTLIQQEVIDEIARVRGVEKEVSVHHPRRRRLHPLTLLMQCRSFLTCPSSANACLRRPSRRAP